MKKSHGDQRKFEIPEHEFEERFEVKPPPKPLQNNTQDNENPPFKDWFFRDSDDDLEASESRYNHIEVHSLLFDIHKI